MSSFKKMERRVRGEAIRNDPNARSEKKEGDPPHDALSDQQSGAKVKILVVKDSTEHPAAVLSVASLPILV